MTAKWLGECLTDKYDTLSLVQQLDCPGGVGGQILLAELAYFPEVAARAVRECPRSKIWCTASVLQVNFVVHTCTDDGVTLAEV